VLAGVLAIVVCLCVYVYVCLSPINQYANIVLLTRILVVYMI